MKATHHSCHRTSHNNSITQPTQRQMKTTTVNHHPPPTSIPKNSSYQEVIPDKGQWHREVELPAVGRLGDARQHAELDVLAEWERGVLHHHVVEASGHPDGSRHQPVDPRCCQQPSCRVREHRISMLVLLYSIDNTGTPVLSHRLELQIQQEEEDEINQW